MSEKEFQSTVLMRHHNRPAYKSELPTKHINDIPTTFDWYVMFLQVVLKFERRNKGAVTPVKDQGQCGRYTI